MDRPELSRQTRIINFWKYGILFPIMLVQNRVSNFPCFISPKLWSINIVLTFYWSITLGYLPILDHIWRFFLVFVFLVFPGRIYIQYEELGKQEMLLVMQRPDGESRLVIGLWYASRGHPANMIGNYVLSDEFHILSSLVDHSFTLNWQYKSYLGSPGG